MHKGDKKMSALFEKLQKALWKTEPEREEFIH